VVEQFRQPATRVRDYQIGDVLGVGGFGVSYEAFHVHLGRHFAIKEYFPATLARRHADGSVGPLTEASKAEQFDKGLERFLREARTLAAISHPNVVQVRDVFVEGGTGFMVMDFIDGDTLEATVLRDGPMAPPKVRHLLDRLSGGLIHVHEAGFLHRDIKPSNILIRAQDGEPVLIDFGAAKSLQLKTSATTQFISHGYSPLEISATRLESGPWTDLYGLCAVAWFALKGKAPPDAMAERFSAEADPLERLSAQGGPWIQFYSAIDAGLALYPKDRPQSLQSLRESFVGTETRMADPAEIAAINAAVARQAVYPSQSTLLDRPVAAAPDALPDEQYGEADDPAPGLLTRFPTTFLGAMLMAGMIAAFFIAARLADPTPDYAMWRLGVLIVIAGTIIGLLVMGLDRAVQWTGDHFGGLAWWGKGLHFLITPAVALIGMLVALAFTLLWFLPPTTELLTATLASVFDFADGDEPINVFLITLLLGGPFVALPLAYSLARRERRQWWQALGTIVGLPALVGFCAPFATVDDAEGLERLGRMGYFVNNEDVSGSEDHDPEAIAEFNAAAISAYQQAEGLNVTGTIDAETWRSLLWSWPSQSFFIDPADGRGALDIYLALRFCRPSCTITLGKGEIDLADFGPEYSDAFHFPEREGEDLFFSYYASTDSNGDVEINGAGNDTVITNGEWRTVSRQRIANVMFRNAHIVSMNGANLTNVTIEAAPGEVALGTEEDGYGGGDVTLDRVTLTTVGDVPAMRFANGIDDRTNQSRYPIRISDTRISHLNGGSGPVMQIGGHYELTMTDGGMTSSGSPFMSLSDGIIAEIDGVDGACLSAFSGAEVTIRRANLTQCGGEGAVVRARSGARVYIDDDTALPALPDLIRFDASDAEILMR